MEDYNVSNMQRLFENGGIRDFVIRSVEFHDGLIKLSIEKKETISKYCKYHLPKYLKFKSKNDVYELEKFYVAINVCGPVMPVFVLKKDGEILEVTSLYECEHSDLFYNKYLDMFIDEIIKED